MRHNTQRWSLIGLAVLTLTVLCALGCGDKEAQNGSSTGSAEKKLLIGIVYDSGGKNDKSFNASAARGIDKAIKELGVEHKEIQSQGEKDYETNLSALAEARCDLVIAVGVNMETALRASASKFPETNFAIVDVPVELPNVRSLIFNEEQGSFLAGYLAGLMTKSNKLGFVGGQRISLIEKFYSGYAAGAYLANPSVEMLPDKYADSWNNADLAKIAAISLYTQGADIVYHAAGKAGIGVFNAAHERGRYAIGVDSDQDELYEGIILTSMIKNVDEAVFSTIKDLKEGNFSPEIKVYDLASGGVGLSPMRFTKEIIGDENLAKIDAVAEKVKSGEIKVPTTKDELAKFRASLPK
ncbi:MAG: BMP family ABC transporter substrate-binding protein [Fimbriimonadaceae bacterium]|nr:BMP family ABC transporter substrate-binding protein [Fimbriimonadaceae bacterium]